MRRRSARPAAGSGRGAAGDKGATSRSPDRGAVDVDNPASITSERRTTTATSDVAFLRKELSSVTAPATAHRHERPARRRRVAGPVAA